jgi:UDP-glucose 6-dehydrogenase
LLEILENISTIASGYGKCCSSRYLQKEEGNARLDKRNIKIEFDAAPNPEFLNEGAAIDDF